MTRILCLLIALILAPAISAKTYTVPEPLTPWVDWVLDKHEDLKCPIGELDYQCSWAKTLQIVVYQKTIDVTQEWITGKSDVWVPLPGSKTHWPSIVLLDGVATPVKEVNGTPSLIIMGAGNHKIIATYKNDSSTDSIKIPSHSPLVELTLNDKRIQQPQIDQSGTLYFSGNQVNTIKSPDENKVTINVSRLIEDSIPLRLTSRIEVRASGSAREIELPHLLPKGFTPLSIGSKIPVRIDGNSLRAQIKPGIWVVELVARSEIPINQFTFFTEGGLWPSNEIWAFKSREDFRQIELKGAQSIDPQQTTIPNNWKNYPTFLAKPATTLEIKEIKRGNPTPSANNLQLDREIWLNFDGKGYSVRDLITGTMNRDWRLNATEELNLGRVTANNKGLFITKSSEGQSGIEIRDQNISLVAESQMAGNVRSFPATGWDIDFNSVSAKLHLPPGWSVISVSGADNAPNTWIGKWSLLDLFFLLVIAAAVTKLWNWRWGLVVVATLTLTTHDYLAPYWVWANLIVASALLRVITHEKSAAWIHRYRIVTVLSLVVISIPYLIGEIRTGIYPQLEHSVHYKTMNQMGRANTDLAKQRKPAQTAKKIQSLGSLRQDSIAREFDYSYQERFASPKAMPAFDPDAKIQTGPGMPEWSGRMVPISWSGPVERGQELSITYITPGVKLVLALLKVLLISALAFCLIEFKSTFPQRWLKVLNPRALSLGSMLIVGIALMSAPGADALASDIPSPEILKELETRLTQKPDCYPNCSSIQSVELEIIDNELSLIFQVHSIENSYIRLPIQTSKWQPSHVLLNGKHEPGMKKGGSGYLIVQSPKGSNEIKVGGPIEGVDALSFSTTSVIHNVYINAPGWAYSGIDELGNIKGQFKLSRKKTAATVEKNILRPSSMPSFLRITRQINMGLDWEVNTSVERISGGKDPVLITLPLLPGESVTSQAHKVKGGEIKIELSAGQNRLSWSSTLNKVDTLELTAKNTIGWTEVWQLNVNPLWRVEADGIPEINHQRNGRHGPTWHPWPGEKLRLNISRPQGVDGATTTMKRIKIETRPGERSTDSSLNMKLLASQGGNHIIKLPEQSKVRSASVDGKKLVIEEGATNIEIPIRPGTQDVVLEWSEKSGITTVFSTPEVDLGLSSVNAHINLKPGHDRWILFVGGPNQGPAVLFWGVLIMVVLIAIGLGRIKGIPIRTIGWVLLGIGLLPISIETSLVVIAWLMALKYRNEKAVKMQSLTALKFNFIQVGIVVLTLLAAVALLVSIEQGLLGRPDMQISGNLSLASDLQWYEDRGDNILASGWALSVPIYFYRISMLLWALWLAFSCLKWISWGWLSFGNGGLWKPVERRKKGDSKKSGKEPAEDKEFPDLPNNSDWENK